MKDLIEIIQNLNTIPIDTGTLIAFILGYIVRGQISIRKE